MSAAANAAPSGPVLSIEHLRLEAASGAVLVEDLNFQIERGEFVALVGESGSGKTLAARTVLGLLPAGIRQTAGAVRFGGENLSSAGVRRMRELRGGSIGMVFQEPMVSLNPAHRIGTQMAEGMRLHTRLGAAQIRARCLAMLERVQIRDPERCLQAYPHEFSGGMRQRIMLASVMLLRPRLLIADEPTTALDNLAQREVLDLMVELAREDGTAVLLITHNLGLVARYAQRAVVMQRGRQMEAGPAAQILYRPQTDYTRQLIAAIPRRAAARPAAASGDTLIAARGLSVSYAVRSQGLFGKRSQRLAIDRLDLEIRAGETVAVVGGSGSGKTTLGRAMLRLAPASAGEVLFRGQDVLKAGGAALHDFRMGCQLVFQDPYSSLDPRMRIRALVAEPLRHLPAMDEAARARRIDETLAEVGLADFGGRFPHELSGGQRQRVAIARALVRRPAFIVADEPVSALDMTIQAQVLALFRSLQEQYGFACMFISHDLAAVEQVADRVVVMQHGLIVESGSRDEIFDRPQHPYTRELLAATPALDVHAQAVASA
ncbi:dipeptide ABC transporter ATP-binding protein [Xylophilus rhododendri]|uniref:Dipeptide ABC transporter ATP-binding protein n=1 Tax=Xylophilus rhododendri TaxID=2697032 RepID=A0A857J862_9BURK|nr:ABC transporter ATP-binding protein [Xylophilus rhododendri]QHI98958.1 dipeptide ABC transporter ATP-binding protein [Xylophilus rhododendri]